MAFDDTRETYAGHVAGIARAEQVHNDMTHHTSYDTGAAADRVYEKAYAAALVRWDAGNVDGEELAEIRERRGY